jgi:hypothetical protein
MFCSKCGRAVGADLSYCSGCGHPLRPPEQTLRNSGMGQRRFDRSIRRLGQFWYIFAGLNLALAAAGFVMYRLGLAGVAVPYEPWPHPPGWDWTMAGSVVWTLVVSRIAVAALAGWGLREHTQWGRPIAFLASAVSFLQFPIGVALAIYTFTLLLGKEHAKFYDHWAQAR